MKEHSLLWPEQKEGARQKDGVNSKNAEEIEYDNQNTIKELAKEGKGGSLLWLWLFRQHILNRISSYSS